MIRLALVDDEKQVLDGIQTVFDLPSYGIELVGAFTDPLLLLENWDSLQPDSVITDMKMPSMSGIELTERIKEKNPDTVIVVLTGYDEFTYVQYALKLGVFDYFLKPIQRQAFSDMLSKLTEKVKQVKAEKTIHDAYSSHLASMENNFLLSLLDGCRNAEQAQELYSQFKFTFQEHPFLLVKAVSEQPENLEEFQKAFTHISNGLFSIKLFHTNVSHYYICYDLKKTAALIYSILNDWLHEYYEQHSISLGSSQAVTGIESICQAHKECNNQIARQFWQQRDNIKAPKSKTYLLSEVLLSINEHDTDKIIHCIKLLFTEYQTTNLDYYYSLAILILNQLQTELNSIPGQHKNSHLLISFEELKSKLSSTQNLCQYLISCTEECMAQFGAVSALPDNHIVLQAIQYISAHYMENINLADIANEAYISRNYLCSIFKKEMGETLMEYLTKYRIDQAKYLISAKKYKIYEVAKMVGYQDYAYFTQIFKKHTGVKPSEYESSAKL